MNDSKNIIIYLRKTNGAGQKITVSTLLTNKSLYTHTAQIFNLLEKNFYLYFKGKLISDSNEQILGNMDIQHQSIIHIKQKAIQSGQTIQLRVFCQGSLYSYQTFKNSTFYSLKQQISNRLGCNINHITISHLGKVIEDNQTLDQIQVQDKDIISIFISTFSLSGVNSTRLKPKLAESLTFAPSDQLDPSYQPFSKEVMRKSSMKSSHQSRQFKIVQTKKQLLNVIRPKSQSNANEQQFEQNLGLLKLPWLSSQKMIQTQSISYDDPQQQQDPQFWKQCKIQIENQQGSVFYTFECLQNHNLQSIRQKLAKCQRYTANKIQFQFSNDNIQKEAEEGKSLIQIAKNSKIKIIHNVIYKKK